MTKPGPPQKLSEEEQLNFVKVLIAASDFGAPLSLMDLRILVHEYLVKNNRTYAFDGKLPDVTERPNPAIETPNVDDTITSNQATPSTTTTETVSQSLDATDNANVELPLTPSKSNAPQQDLRGTETRESSDSLQVTIMLPENVPNDDQTLKEIKNGRFNGDDVAKSIGIKKVMLDLEFRIAMVVAKKILSTLQPADAALQARSAGLKDAITIIKCVKDEIIKLRSNQMYNQILEEAKSLTSNDCGESENRTQTSKRQVKKPNRMDDYLTYTPCSSARQNIDENDEPFKSEYFETLDILIAELQRRFSDNDDLINSIASLDELDVDKMVPLKNLGLKIPSREEASVVKAYLSRNEDIMENTLQVLYRQREAFKDTYELFASVATIGCSTAVCESTFSTLTAINRPQRLSMGHERMADTGSEIIRCPLCLEIYIEPPNEDWIQCSQCEAWWHDQCTDYLGFDRLY
ncbi:hypothetical protein PYW08_009165 [Mythimna loreyi]|uniref:Uncharacterized protein n=1 Tax=Mythimna loreyi TaxID=667449 RepID=A0ACC2Q9N5_9NEOP|nr:hypothetical protein PYW08_009165 [Mythimna loreyi]